MRCGIAFAKRLLDFVFDGAGDFVSARDIQMLWYHDMKIHPVIPSAVAVAQLVI